MHVYVYTHRRAHTRAHIHLSQPFVVPGRHGVYKYHEDLSSGDLIGEHALLGLPLRMESILTMSPCDLLVIKGDAYTIIGAASKEKSMALNDKYNFLCELPNFKHWESYDICLLARVMREVEVKKEHDLVQKGTEAGCLSFILEGVVDCLLTAMRISLTLPPGDPGTAVVHSDISHKACIATLQRSEYFGESSILRHFVLEKDYQVGIYNLVVLLWLTYCYHSYYYYMLNYIFL